MEKLLLFLGILTVIGIIGVIPYIVREETLHDFIHDVYHSHEENIDVIMGELFKNKYLIAKHSISNCTNRNNCTSRYWFVEPVRICFDISSKFKGCSTVKVFVDVVSLTVFCLDGDVECHIVCVDKSKCLFLFSDIHSIDMKIN